MSNIKMLLDVVAEVQKEAPEDVPNFSKRFAEADLSKNDLKYFRKKFKKYLTNEDYIKRADYLAWENKYYRW